MKLVSSTIIAAFALTAAAPAAAVAFNVVSCGQSVPQGEVGVLQNDLSCGASSGILLDRAATLDLNGHEISGGSVGVLCLYRRCTVRWPGRITGVGGCAIQPSNGSGRIRIDLEGFDLDANDCAVAGSSAKDIRLFLLDMNVTNNGSGLSAGKITGRNLTVTGDHGFAAMDGRRAVRLIDSTIENNEGIGIIARRTAMLRTTSVVNNDLANGFDVAAGRMPRVSRSACGRSAVVPIPFSLPDSNAASWGVCAND